MQITIFRGTHEIGGNCVEVRSGSSRLILDVGMPLVDAEGKPFDSKTLRGKSVRRLLGEGVLPKVPGLFAIRPTRLLHPMRFCFRIPTPTTWA